MNLRDFAQGYANISTIYLRLNTVNNTYHKYNELVQGLEDVLDNITRIDYKVTFNQPFSPREEKFFEAICKFNNQYVSTIEDDHPAELAKLILNTIEEGQK